MPTINQINPSTFAHKNLVVIFIILRPWLGNDDLNFTLLAVRAYPPLNRLNQSIKTRDAQASLGYPQQMPLL